MEAPKNLYYVVSANVFGFLITTIIASIMAFVFLALFATTLGGAWGLAAGSLVGLVILIALIPILIFSVRFFLFRFFEITETKFRLVYSLASTGAVLVGLIGLWSMAMLVLSALTNS